MTDQPINTEQQEKPKTLKGQTAAALRSMYAVCGKYFDNDVIKAALVVWLPAVSNAKMKPEDIKPTLERLMGDWDEPGVLPLPWHFVQAYKQIKPQPKKKKDGKIDEGDYEAGLEELAKIGEKLGIGG